VAVARLTPALEAALDKLAQMKHPSAEKLLRSYNYNYEADVVAAVVIEWEKTKKL
jgi:hypothetical protein